jgi:hypothetical protein
MPGARALLALSVLLVPGCSGDRDRPPQAPATVAVEPAGCKPVAPVTVVVRATAVGGGVHELVVEAVPDTDVSALELQVVAPGTVTVLGDARRRFGVTAANTRRRATFRVQLEGPGAVVPVSARVRLADGIEPNEVAEVTIGSPPPAPAPVVRTLALPGGLRVDEVMP